MKLDTLACPLCLYGMRVWIGVDVVIGIPLDRQRWRSRCNYGRHCSGPTECPHLQSAAETAINHAATNVLAPKLPIQGHFT